MPERLHSAHQGEDPYMSDKLLIKLPPELKKLIDDEANRLAAEGIYGGMGEVAVRILAEHFNRPDLARVPRKRTGRPPALASAS